MPAIARAAIRAIHLSGGGFQRGATIDTALFFQMKLHDYMKRVFMPIPSVCTTGSHMFWTVKPHGFDANNVSVYLRSNYDICVESDVLTNSLIINPPVVKEWHDVQAALNTMADIFDAPEYTCELMMLNDGNDLVRVS